MIRPENVVKYILIVVLVLTAAVFLLRVIGDPDFFWHLKTGEWIWEHKALPEEDPFAYTAPRQHDDRSHFILAAYWPVQVLYYFLYSVFGFPGIIGLRVCLAGLLLYFMFKRPYGDKILYLGLLIIFLVSVLGKQNNSDRPQAVSFVSFAALLYLLEAMKNPVPGNKDVQQRISDRFSLSGAFLMMSGLMLLWSNSHGAYILGQATIIIYLAGEGIKFILPALRPMEKTAYSRLALVGAAAILLSFVNPNTYHAWVQALTIDPGLVETNLEYQSTLVMFRDFHDYSMLPYWFVLVLTAAALVLNARSAEPAITGVLVVTAYLSFTAMRYIPFFLIAALPAAGEMLSKKSIPWVRYTVIAAAISSSVFFAWGERMDVLNITANRWTDSFAAPESLVDFIERHNIKGNMYNHYQYGGYFIWRMAPVRKVFVDGRALYPDIVRNSELINDAAVDEKGDPTWKDILEFYRIRYMVLPLFDPEGEVLPIVHAMAVDMEWVPVYYDFYSIIFVKDTSENAHVISRSGISRTWLLPNLPR